MEESVAHIVSNCIADGRIYDVSQIMADPHVKAREMFIPMEHPTLGSITGNGCAVKLEDTKPSVRTPAPALGEHSEEILSSYLGLSPEEVAQLREKSVL